jgi:hypothetical protein
MSNEKDNNINNSNGCNNNNNMNDILQTIANLSSQSNESSNIILNAISNGITTGVSQGIASGNIAVSFQDLISLVSLIKPTNEIPLQLINRIPTFDTYHGSTTSNSQASNTIHSDGYIGKTLANPDSHDFNQASSGIPSSVHVFDVTVEKYPAQELPVSLRVSETADDQNVKKGNVSNASDEVCLVGSIYGSSLDTGSTSRKRSNQFFSEDDSSDQLKSRLRHDSLSMRQNRSPIESLLGLNEYISSACEVMTEELEVAHNKSLSSNGKCTTIKIVIILLVHTI